MDNLTQAQLALLASAETAAGEPVHPGLRILCDDGECDVKKGYIQWTGDPYCEPGSTELVKHPECGGNQWLPNADPLAMIAACQKQGWTVHFSPSNNNEDARLIVPVGHVIVSIFEYQTARIAWAQAADNLAALVDGVFQATKTLDPANWETCSVMCPALNPTCANCHGTGILLRAFDNQTEGD